MKIILSLILCLSIAGCTEERVKPGIDTSFNVEELPAQESWNSKIIFSDSGKTKAILDAGHLRVFAEAKETLLDQNIKIDFYDEEEKKTTTLTAKRGRVDDATQNLYAIDSVVVRNEDSTIVTTDELMWKNQDRKIVSDKFVTIISPKEKIEGYGFESDQNLENYVIYNITYITRRDTL
jgi:LPS export ABC transporter protein LptC